MATTTRLTAEDLHEITAPGKHELIDGKLVSMAPAGGEHAEIGVNVIVPLSVHVRAHQLGRVYGPDAGFLIARDPEDQLLSPDVAYVAAERLPPPEQRSGFLPLAPDLAVEVVSPWDRASEVDDKVQRYLRAGTLMVLVVQPGTRTIVAWLPDGSGRVYHADDMLDLDAVVPGFTIAVSEVFA